MFETLCVCGILCWYWVQVEKISMVNQQKKLLACVREIWSFSSMVENAPLLSSLFPVPKALTMPLLEEGDSLLAYLPYVGPLYPYFYSMITLLALRYQVKSGAPECLESRTSERITAVSQMKIINKIRLALFITAVIVIPKRVKETLKLKGETATVEPERVTTTVEPESETATVEQESETATVEPENETATVEQESETVTVEPESETATLAPESLDFFQNVCWEDFKIEDHSSEFALYDVPGDGNCMFHSISRSLKARYGEKVSHTKMRQRVVQDLRDNPVGDNGIEFKYFIAPLDYSGNTEHPDKMSKSTEKLPTEEQRIEKRWLDYLHRLKGNAYGDDICLISAARIYETRIIVFSINGASSYTASFGSPKAKKTIFLQLETRHYMWLDRSSFIPESKKKNKRKKRKNRVSKARKGR